MPRRDFTKVPFAATGDATSIPTAVQPDGSVSMTTGYGFDYQRDNGAGGGTPDPLAKNIDREDMNGILNEITASIGEMQQNGFPIWVATAAPYPLNAIVRQPSDDKVYRSTVTNNSTVPGAVGADWLDVSGIGAEKPVNRVVFTSSGTYVPTAGVKAVFVQVQAGGGGGGGSHGAGTGSSSASGGSAGGYHEGYLPASSVGVSQAVTVGLAGSGGIGVNSGTAGTASSFGALLTTTGGSFGTASNSFTQILRGAVPDGAGGGTGSTQNGQNGGIGIIIGTAQASIGGDGGSSRLGAGGRGRNEGSNGFSGQGWGSGGAGGASSTITQNGGPGRPGIVIVWEFF